MSKIKKTDARLLNEAIEGLTQAIGAAAQLTHARNPKWMVIKRTLEVWQTALKELGTWNMQRVHGVKRK